MIVRWKWLNWILRRKFITPVEVRELNKKLKKLAMPPWKDGFYHFEYDKESDIYISIREEDA
ncbi:MAG: hypothetical protein KAS32_21970 [Candidatus Peribacteraceae bacterium]|nr:hypothetical protein [Candidatus Peribacteraceae bacterium]